MIYREKERKKERTVLIAMLDIREIIGQHAHTKQPEHWQWSETYIKKSTAGSVERSCKEPNRWL
jgi:hypothetical protein